ncbi:MAG: UDP-3-O-(3-hydroxymyristoyl)glucosamine N-acyltransferase [Magnetococcales bacterium]|nr:UDP-3-O-(3-hydroxymyristoyl)glucosamine N-acyltransferase [Magnetococcales bacterium]MBF0155759.1 UDP-3-O-(3-hydroxymyristoyl)glucosamine N-acyltransferase [Magnetococcales bacterium]
MKLAELSDRLGLRHRGGNPEILGVAPLAEAGPDDLTFVTEKGWLSGWRQQAGAVVIPESLAGALPESTPMLISRSPAVDIGRAACLLGGKTLGVLGVHPRAIVDPTARLGEGVGIGPGAVIGAEVTIGDESVVHAGAVILDRCVIGRRCIIHANAVVGADGFGYEVVDGRLVRIPHLGIVRIEDDVEVGACTTIDRARFGETLIGNGTKIDNLVQIAHNCRIGRQVTIVSQVGISGSCVIEEGAVLAGQAGVVPHVTIGRGARIGASTGVTGDVAAGETLSGWWGRSHRRNMTELAALRKLPEFMKSMRELLSGK